MNPLIQLLFGILFSTNLLYPGIKQPDWVKKHPISKDYYIGIGIAKKIGGDKEYIQTAKNNALNELASEITVSISSEMISSVVEQSGLLEEEFRKEIQSSTKADLEGFELVDIWEDKKEYWVYYRLSKVLYEGKKRLKLEKAISLSLDFFTNARNRVQENNIAEGLTFYVQALNPIKDHIAEPLVTIYEGSEIFLRNEILSSFQSLVSGIELKTRPEKLNAKVGRPLQKPLEVSAVYINDSGEEIKVSNLPITFSFIRGSGELVEKVKTDRTGKARCYVAKITAMDKIQIIKSQMDIHGSIDNDSSSVLVQSILKNLSVPSKNFILKVTGLNVFLESRETNLGANLNVPYITPKFKNQLSNSGFSFVEDMSEADLIIQLSAESRKGSEIYGQYIAFVDLEISALDMSTGDEVFSDALRNIKGIQLDYNKAGLKAFEIASEMLNIEILPDLIETVQR